jgi:GT2 family glycosyltransferase
MNLNYPSFETIVVDSGSMDGSADMVEEEFPSVKLLRRRKCGIAEAINQGIASAKGEFLAFEVNSDDVVSKEWLHFLVKSLLSSSKIGIVGGKRFLLEEHGLLDSAGGKILLGVTYALGHGKRDSGKYSIGREVDYVPVIVTRKQVVDRIGRLDEGFDIYGEDVDFCLRARKAGYKVVYVPDAVFWHKRSAGVGVASTRRLYYLILSRVRLILKHYSPVKKIGLLLFHATVVSSFYITYYTYLSRGHFFDFLKASLRSFSEGMKP